MPIPWKKSYDQPRQHITKQRHYLANKGPSSQTYGFSSSHAWMWELDYKERVSWTTRSSNKSILKEIGFWVFIGRTDAKAGAPILWPPDAKRWLIWKDPDAGKDWGQEKKGMTEDEMVGWHHWLSGYGFGWTPGVGDRQGGLACCSSWSHKESDMTERMNWTEMKWNLERQ